MKIDSARLEAIARRWPAELRLVLLHGADASASRDHATRLAAQFAGAVVEELTGAVLAGDPQALVSAATSLSMFGDATLVRVERLDDAGVPAVEALLAAPAGHPVIALADVLRKGSKLLALAEASPAIAALVSYEPNLSNAGAIVGDIAGPLGLRCGRDVAAALFQATAGNRQLLRQELAKLALYLDAGPDTPRTVDPDAVAAIGVGVADVAFDDIAIAVTGGRPQQTVDLLGEQEAGVMIPTLRAVGRRLQLLQQLGERITAGLSPDRAVKGIGAFWKLEGGLLADQRALPPAFLAQGMGEVLAVERAIKAAGSPGEILAARALVALARRAQALHRRGR